jgi:hypothetical protein
MPLLGWPPPELQCPWCGADVDASDGQDPGDRPHAGAASVCYSCSRISIFVHTVATGWGRVGLGLRRATPPEAEEIGQLPAVAEALAQLRRDPTRRVRGPGDAEAVTQRWRAQLALNQPLPGLPPLDKDERPPAR